MRITVEISLYPLQGQPLERILAFIETIRGDARLEVVVNQMSTQLRGELADVLDVLRTALERSFTGGGPQALVAKFLNADLPIGEPPVLELPSGRPTAGSSERAAAPRKPSGPNRAPRRPRRA